MDWLWTNDGEDIEKWEKMSEICEKEIKWNLRTLLSSATKSQVR